MVKPLTASTFFPSQGELLESKYTCKPFESLVDITGNLIKGEKIEPNQTGLLVNSEDH